MLLVVSVGSHFGFAPSRLNFDLVWNKLHTRAAALLSVDHQDPIAVQVLAERWSRAGREYFVFWLNKLMCRANQSPSREVLGIQVNGAATARSADLVVLGTQPHVKNQRFGGDCGEHAANAGSAGRRCTSW